MNFSDIIFYIFSILIVGAALLTVFSSRAHNKITGLLIFVTGIPVMFFLLNSDYFAVLYLLISFAGILPLLYMAHLTTNGTETEELPQLNFGGAAAMLTLGIFTAITTVTLVAARWKEQNPAMFSPQFGDISSLLVSKYMLTLQFTLFITMIMAAGSANVLRKN